MAEPMTHHMLKSKTFICTETSHNLLLQHNSILISSYLGGIASLAAKTIPLDYRCLDSLRSIPTGKQCQLYRVWKKYPHSRPSCWQKWVPGFTPWESEECRFTCR
ncbi:hypothetical protein BsWGS_20877 [Bradybaena similaris]